MQLARSSSLDAEGGLLFEQGPFAGQRYRLELQICQNPVCQCEHISLHCFPETKEPPQGEPLAPICLEMDLAQCVIENLQKLKAEPRAFHFAKAVESEISEAQWNQLRKLYLAVKRHQTEHADLNQLEAMFPPEILAGDGSVVGYYEILPYAEPVEVTLGADAWLLDDQYCIRPACSCRDAVLSFIPQRFSTSSDGSPTHPSLSLRYAYDTGRIEMLDAAEAFRLSGQDCLNALQSAHPDLNSLLGKRHVLLRQLFLRAFSRQRDHIAWLLQCD